jgi:peptidoglycan/LPS O-acetylase OafA/YrhL
VPPLEDVSRLLRTTLPQPRTAALLAAVTGLAAIAAFARDTAEHASTGGAALTAAIEAVAVIACFLTLGGQLGLWRRDRSDTLGRP